MHGRVFLFLNMIFILWIILIGGLSLTALKTVKLHQVIIFTFHQYNYTVCITLPISICHIGT